MKECKRCGHGKTAHKRYGCRECHMINEFFENEDRWNNADINICPRWELDNLVYVERCYERQKKKKA
jgi:hypothetical protein